LKLKLTKCAKCKQSKLYSEFISQITGDKCTNCNTCNQSRDNRHYGSLGGIIRRKINDCLKNDRKYKRPYTLENQIDHDYCKELVRQYILKNGYKCVSCGDEMIFENIKHAKNQFTFDRIDNTLAHIKGNIQIICKSCNCHKR